MISLCHSGCSEIYYLLTKNTIAPQNMSYLLSKLKQQAPSTSTSSAPIAPTGPAKPITHSHSRYPNPIRRPRRSSLPAPAPPPDAPTVAVFGAGSRGTAYSTAIRASALARILTVCEPRDAVRDEFGRTFIWGADRKAGEGEAWGRWEEWVEWERERRANGAGASVDIVFVCVLDEMHVAACKAVTELGGIHILCEKPLATTLQGCLDIWAAVRRSWEANGGKQTVFGIGHVLRYSPHNVLLRKLIREDKVIGDVVSIEHTEPIGWWHFTHSYVR
jgi:predicted dehydrogenase